MSSDDWRERALRALANRMADGLRRATDDSPHLVVCGDTALAHGLIQELQRGRVRVTAVVPRQRSARSANVDAMRGVRIVRADRVDSATLRAAGVAGADAVALTDPDDVANLHAAFCAREVDPGVRLVLRMFNSELAAATRTLLADCAVFSDASMAAPTFVAAALGEIVPAHFRLFGRTLTVARRREVTAAQILCGLAAPGADGLADLLPADESRADLVLAEMPARDGRHDDSFCGVRPRPRGPRRAAANTWWALRAAARRGTTVALACCLLVVAVAGWVLITAPGPQDRPGSALEALYQIVLTTVGASDIDPAAADAAQGAQLVLTLAGLVLLPLITAVLVEAVVNVRLARESDQLRHPWEDHVVVVGLGDVGVRVVRQLRDLGMDVVAVEKDPAVRGHEVARRLHVPVIVGDGTEEEVLRSAWVQHCRALLVLSTDDVANLQAALVARNVRPRLRVVLRLSDGDFAARVQRAFAIGVSRSVSAVSAPVFAAQMLRREVLATIPVDRHVLQVAVVTVEPGAALVGRTVKAAGVPGDVRVIAVESGARRQWNPAPDLPLGVGDRIVAVCRRAGLAGLVAQAQPAAADEADGVAG